MNALFVPKIDLQANEYGHLQIDAVCANRRAAAQAGDGSRGRFGFSEVSAHFSFNMRGEKRGDTCLGSVEFPGLACAYAHGRRRLLICSNTLAEVTHAKPAGNPKS